MVSLRKYWSCLFLFVRYRQICVTVFGAARMNRLDNNSCIGNPLQKIYQSYNFSQEACWYFLKIECAVYKKLLNGFQKVGVLYFLRMEGVVYTELLGGVVMLQLRSLSRLGLTST